MRRTIPAAIAVCFSLCALSAALGEAPPFPLEDFTEFGFFNPLPLTADSISSARITLEPDGSYRLEMTVVAIEDGPPLGPECPDFLLRRAPPLFDVCLRPRRLSERRLSSKESDRLLDIFTHVNIEYRGGCPLAGFGRPPEWFGWDSFSASSSFCDPPSVAWPESGMIVREMARLKNGSRDCNRNGRLDVFDFEDGSSADVDENGLPDECQANFQRGDSNGDGRVDVSDPIRTLGAIFHGRDVIPCFDAADFDDNARIDVSDAIATLLFLFEGGSAPPACGVDATEDSLDCSWPAGCG